LPAAWWLRLMSRAHQAVGCGSLAADVDKVQPAAGTKDAEDFRRRSGFSRPGPRDASIIDDSTRSNSAVGVGSR